MNELILVVEDSLTQAILLESNLQRQHYRVAIVANGQDAIKWLSENKPSLVIADILMPGMNGFELCRQIKAHDSTNDIPVILLTSLTGSDEVIEGLVAGADSFITKPYDRNYLISHIEKLLADQSGIETEKKSFGVEIIFEGKKRIIQAEQQQTIKLLLNIYDGAIQQNTQLFQMQEQLKLLNENLESMVEERTSDLLAEIETRKRVENELKEREHFLKTITSEVQEVIFAYDAKGIFTFSEGKGLQKLGLKPGQLVGKSVFEFYKDHPQIVFAMKEALNGLARKTEGLEIGGLKLNTTLQPIFDKKDNVTSVVGLAIDVTEHPIPQNSDHWFS